MQRIILCLFLISTSVFYAQEKEVQKTIDAFFVGLNSKDTLTIKKTCHKEIILQSIVVENQSKKLQTDDYNDFLKSIADIPENVIINEKLLSYEIQIDDNLAHVWTPYEFYVNGKLSHKGANSFTLIKEDDSWQIIHIIDTRRRD